MPSVRERIATNVRALRAERNWSQEQLALEAGLHRTFIGHVELARRNLSVDNLEKIASALDVDVSRLLAKT